MGKIVGLRFTDWYLPPPDYLPHVQPGEFPGLVEAAELGCDFGVFYLHLVLNGCLGLLVPERF